MSKSTSYKAYCPTCQVITEKSHNKNFVKKLCEHHNESRECGDAHVVPVCWVCQNRATHQNVKPPYEYTCDDHSLSIDMTPIQEVNL